MRNDILLILPRFLLPKLGPRLAEYATIRLPLRVSSGLVAVMATSLVAVPCPSYVSRNREASSIVAYAVCNI